MRLLQRQPVSQSNIIIAIYSQFFYQFKKIKNLPCHVIFKSENSVKCNGRICKNDLSVGENMVLQARINSSMSFHRSRRVLFIKIRLSRQLSMCLYSLQLQTKLLMKGRQELRGSVTWLVYPKLFTYIGPDYMHKTFPNRLRFLPSNLRRNI